MTKERLFRKTYAPELLKVAKADLETASTLIRAKLARRENILFHIQQAIEKSLKAYLCWLEMPVPMVHELAILVDRLPKNCQLPHADDIDDLTQFATIRRYEEGIARIEDDELTAAEKIAKEILSWVEQNLR